MCNKPKYLSLITISQIWQRRTFKREMGKYHGESFLYPRLCCKPRQHALHTGKRVPWITNDGLGESLFSDGSWGIEDDSASGLRLIASFCLDESFPAQERCTAEWGRRGVSLLQAWGHASPGRHRLIPGPTQQTPNLTVLDITGNQT